MKEFDSYQIDAFTDHIFGGNPAVVCYLPEPLPEAVMLAIARENNQSETAFVTPRGDSFELRYFTIISEIDLCGHATLSAGHVLFHHRGYDKDEAHFVTPLAGKVSVRREGDWLTLDFPNWMPQPLDNVPAAAREGLGNAPIREAHVMRDYMLVLDSEDAVRAVKPNFKILSQLNHMVSITAPGDTCDFVSRFFCPGDAHEEDPVTGSAHSMLAPYWAARLGKSQLTARQLSNRGGALRCAMHNDRVHISGQARTYLQGKIFLPD